MDKIDYSEVRNLDDALYNEWKDNPNKKNMGRLIHQMSPIIYKEVRNLTGPLPAEAAAAEAKKWAVKAVKTYKPEKGTALSTHMTGYVRRARRMKYQYQNSARLPEDLQLQYHKWSMAQADLESELNREPTDREMATRLGWSNDKVKKYKSMLYADHFESGAERATDMYEFDNDKIRFNYIIKNLDEKEKFLLYNAKEMPATELSDKLGVNINQLNYMKKKLRQKIEDLQGKIGYY